MDHGGQLVDAPARVVGGSVDVLGAKVPPLEPVHGAQVALGPVRQADAVEVLARPVTVPDLDALLAQRLGGRVALDEPEELGRHRFEEDAFCGEEREDGCRAIFIEAEFERSWGEEGICACSCPAV